jgi:hypothetical protein
MEANNDLSEYERIRLENIKRNDEFLKSLGFNQVSKVIKEEEKVRKRELAKEKKSQTESSGPDQKRIKLSGERPVGTRRSARLRGLEEKRLETEQPVEQEEEDEGAEEEPFYQRMPLESNELDDFEFQIFVQLKKWRLAKARELSLEPYAVFQNRCLAEFIRRKRNHPDWASLKDMSSHSESEQEDEVKRLEKELVKCWGIGPAKARFNHFGYELNTLFYPPQQTATIFQEMLSESCKLEKQEEGREDDAEGEA